MRNATVRQFRLHRKTEPSPALDAVDALASSTDPVERAHRAAVLLEHRRIELVMYHDLLKETGRPTPPIPSLLAADEAYQLLTLEAYA